MEQVGHGLLSALKGRLAEVERERERVAQQLQRLEAEAAELSEESVHLRALIERHQAQVLPDSGAPSPQPAESSTADGEAWNVETTAGQPAAGQAPGEPPSNRWLLVATEVLAKGEGPMHYRELYKRMKALGAPAFGGQNPVATFLAAVSREAARPGSSVRRVGRGEYALAAVDSEFVQPRRGKKASGSAA